MYFFNIIVNIYIYIFQFMRTHYFDKVYLKAMYEYVEITYSNENKCSKNGNVPGKDKIKNETFI